MPAMAIKILLVDAYEAHRKVIIGFIRNLRSDVEVHSYNIGADGLPDENFQWSQYSLLLLDSRLDSASGLDWLKDYRDKEGFPPAVFLSSQNSVDVAVQAMKLGATDFICKKGINPKRLRQVLAEVLPPARPLTDLMPDMKPLPEHYETQQYEVAQTQVMPASTEVPEKIEQESDDDYWDQQTQVLHVPPKPAKGN